MSEFVDDVLGIDPNGGGISNIVSAMNPITLVANLANKASDAIYDLTNDGDAEDAQKKQDEITKQQLSAADRAEARGDEIWNFWRDNYSSGEIDLAARAANYNAADLKPGLDRLDTLSRNQPQVLAGLRPQSIVSPQSYLNESRAPIDYYETDPLQYETEAGRAAAEVQQSADREREASGRRMLSRGINPNSGAAMEFDRLAGLQTSANKVFASNTARDVARTGAYSRKMTDYQRRIQGMGLAGDADQAEFNRGLSLSGEQRAASTDQFNQSQAALNARMGVDNNVFNRQLATQSLGRGLAPTALALSNQSMSGLQSASNAYGQIANRPNPAMQDLMGVAQLAGTAYGM